jgi:hypothetical protein
MADEDEDLSHMRAPDAGDIDPTEETPDFRLLDRLKFVRSLTAQGVYTVARIPDELVPIEQPG